MFASFMQCEERGHGMHSGFVRWQSRGWLTVAAGCLPSHRAPMSDSGVCCFATSAKICQRSPCLYQWTNLSTLCRSQPHVSVCLHRRLICQRCVVCEVVFCRAGLSVRLARPYALKKIQPSKMPVIYSHSKFINFTVKTASRYSILWLLIAAAASCSVAARQSVSLPPLPGHRLTDWAHQKLALEPGSLRPQQTLIRP